MNKNTDKLRSESSSKTEPAPNRFIVQGKFRKAAGVITAPENSGLRLVFNVIDTEVKLATDLNKMLATKWKKSREEAKGWFAGRNNFKLGEIQSVAVQSDVWVINALAATESGLSLDGLEKAMKKTAALALYEKASVHIAEDFLALEGVQALAQKLFAEAGVNVYVYSAPAK